MSCGLQYLGQPTVYYTNTASQNIISQTVLEGGLPSIYYELCAAKACGLNESTNGQVQSFSVDNTGLCTVSTDSALTLTATETQTGLVTTQNSLSRDKHSKHNSGTIKTSSTIEQCPSFLPATYQQTVAPTYTYSWTGQTGSADFTATSLQDCIEQTCSCPTCSYGGVVYDPSQGSCLLIFPDQITAVPAAGQVQIAMADPPSPSSVPFVPPLS